MTSQFNDTLVAGRADIARVVVVMKPRYGEMKVKILDNMSEMEASLIGRLVDNFGEFSNLQFKGEHEKSAIQNCCFNFSQLQFKFISINRIWQLAPRVK